MQPLLQSLDPVNNINRDPHGFGLSQATFVNDQASDVQRIYEDLYSKVKNGDLKGVRYLLGINDNDSFSQMQSINIQKIVDEKKNTLLMHAVWKDHTKLFTDLIKYSLQLFGESDTQLWVIQQNDSGNQCMHLATQKGNIAILDAIFKLGIKLDQKTRQGQTTLHIASQSDQPIMLYYLINIAKVNIDITDNDYSTALHLASYSGSEQCAAMLLAWGCKINSKNVYGCTPLHVTAISGEYKITRKLLLYNAKTRLRNKQGKTAYELSVENDFLTISQMIMEYQEGNIKCNNLFGQKNKPRINHKSRLQMYAFILMLILNLIYQILFTLGNNLFGYIQIILDIFEIFLFVYIINSDPGYQIQYKQEGQVFYQILQNNPKKLEICSECETLKAKRSRHCDFCNRCIIVYDHHCPWINNCIGAKNHFLFMIFIWITFLTIGFQLFVSIILFINIIWKQSYVGILSSNLCYWDVFDILFNTLTDLRKYLSISKGVKIEFIVLELLVTLMFFVLLSHLICTQLKNMYYNRTTFERLSKKYRGFNNQQSSLLESSYIESDLNNSNCLKNCSLLLFRNKHSKDYNYVYHDNTSLTTAIIS
ncbi:unnamed protein product [Paramecium pentaurelia]|uniref:Palmitoyltransferase n=1 Tax=Paramecium pentaurelia TaxID=43138 RepID=A0A8S1THC4_9CILI|nr:unnamed protein product [Paramecium pentaurelia]